MAGKGRPRKWTPEEAAELRRVRNRTASKRRKAQRAIAEGRTPGLVGNPRRFTAEQRTQSHREAVAKWRANNLEESRKRDAAYKRRLRREKAKLEGRKLQKVGGDPRFTPEEQREKSRRRSLEYWKRNPERRRELAQKFYLENREKCRIKAKNRRALKKFSAPGRFTVDDIEYLWTLQKGRCILCLKRLYHGKFHVDHHVPLALGGANDRSNLRLLHKKCNLEKGARDPHEHAKRNGLLCW